jgi:hypothetical protein
MKFLQYRVDFTPEIDHPGLKKALIRVHDQMTLLFFSDKLPINHALWNRNRIEKFFSALPMCLDISKRWQKQKVQSTQVPS